MESRKRVILSITVFTWGLNMCKATSNQTDPTVNIESNEITVTPSYTEKDAGRTFNQMSPIDHNMGASNNLQDMDAVEYHQRWMNHHQQQLQNAELMKNDQDTSFTYNRHGEYETYDHLDHDDYHHQHPWDLTSMKPFIKMPMKPMKMLDFSSIDFMKIAMVAVLKLVLFKIQTIGTVKFLAFLLMKIPIILIKIALKVMFVMKMIQILKYLAIPFLLPTILHLLAPLIPLLLPLLLLPLLLPLLLFLPIPVLAMITTSSTTTTTTTTVAPNSRRKRHIAADDGFIFDRQKLDMAFFRKLVDSEMCLERIACNLAADKKASSFSSLVLWILDSAKVYVNHPRYKSYFEAYRLGTSSRANKRLCSNFYPCNGLRKA
ncbi:hypothetical protein LSTR_LSTR009317 [Laodelphax striatellus]|uniref:Uncharacterized protein n=1 Tax=Laodelphax striatellus TaxID=195883 RepID=A0A482XHQ1_LAOST|nr:hypothetical protein LSTR_LSTR009317 [Laodelphax striatellus]